MAPMVTNRVSAWATPSAVGVGVVTRVRSPAAVRPLIPRFTAPAGPPAEVGRCAA